MERADFSSELKHPQLLAFPVLREPVAKNFTVPQSHLHSRMVPIAPQG